VGTAFPGRHNGTVSIDTGHFVNALDTDCEKVLKQIEDLKYEAALKKVGIKNVKKYGIACFEKYCRVMMA
jgi:hypothetical protein